MYFSRILVQCEFAVLGALAFASKHPEPYYGGKGSKCPATPVLDASFTTPVPFFSLPTIFPEPTAPQNPVDFIQIRNTINLYPLAVDGKNYGALGEVFTPNVVANLSQGGLIHGLPALEGAIGASFVHVTTQHQLGTQYIDIIKGGCQAKSVTYFTATLLGTGKFYGQVSYYSAM